MCPPDGIDGVGPARKLSGSWTRPNAPKRLNRPSWIGTPRAAFEAVAAQIDAEEAAKAVAAPMTPSMMPLSTRSSLPPGMRRTSSGSAFVAIAHGQASPMISSAREVELEGEVVALRGELAMLLKQLDSVKAVVIEESEPEIVRLALAVAARVVGREVAADPSLMHQWIEEGTRALPNRGEITVAASPDIAAMIGEVDGGARPMTIDPLLAPGACELREGASVVNVGADARMAAMADALGVDS